MSRVDASFLAVHKARQQGHDPAGAVLASDAFFPFPDGVEEAAAAGVSPIIQPGGSVKDAQVTAAADQHDLALMLPGMREFLHKIKRAYDYDPTPYPDHARPQTCTLSFHAL